MKLLKRFESLNIPKVLLGKSNTLAADKDQNRTDYVSKLKFSIL